MITFLTLITAVGPGLLMCYYIYQSDRHEKEPIPLLVISWGLGVVVFFLAKYFEGAFDESITPLIITQSGQEGFQPSTNLGALLLFAFVRTAFIEEFLKLIFLLLIPFNHKAFNEPMDGIVYAAMIGMGFAIIENLEYCMPYDFTLALLRDFTAVPSHGVFGVILGYYVGLAKFNKSKRIQYILVGLFLTVFIHGLYDIFLFQEYQEWLMILATFVLLSGLFFSRRFITRHQEDSPFKVKVVAAVEAQNEEAIPDNSLKEEDNEILSAVLFEMKEKQEAAQKTEEEE